MVPVFTLLCYSCALFAIETNGSYIAAVYEHIHRDPFGLIGREGVKRNLAAFEEAAKIASQNGADIIVFPEYGIVPFRIKRNTVASYAEHVPDPEEQPWNPSLQEEVFGNSTILTKLSSIARTGNIAVVANMAAKEPCFEEGCPADKQYLLNTNVVFNRNGTIIARYYKRFLFLEGSYDVHPKSKTIIFEEDDVGRFGTIVCFDILFKPASEMVEKYNLRSVAFPTLWGDSHPSLTSIQFQEAWAIRHNVTLLAANLHFPIYGTTGSGIYTGEGATVYTHTNDSSKAALLISKVNDPGTALVITQDVPDVQLPSGYRYKEFNLVNYTLSEIVSTTGEVSACNRGLCCMLAYKLSEELSERYYLAVVNGTRDDVPNRYAWCEEVCMLVRCEDLPNRRCAKFPSESSTVFSEFHLRGNFTSEYVYPSVLLSGVELLPTSLWSYDIYGDSVDLRTTDEVDVPLLSVSLYGRCYDRDPPYRP